MAADIVTSFNGQFTGLSRPDDFANANRTSHLRRGSSDPAGGNILLLDGHVVWRPFKEMKIRSTGNDLWF
jgi:prepilin-type processing-associated H-X9-DG protein